MKLKFLLFLLFLCAYTAMAAPKPTVAIMDLQCQGLSGPDVVLLTDRLLSELGKIGTYDIVERAKRDEILQEQGFTMTGACDQTSCLIEAGKMLSASKMVGGSIGKFGQAWVVNLRLVDVSTGRIDKTVDRDFTGPQENLLLLMREAAGELLNKDILLPEEKALLEKGRKDIAQIETEYSQAQRQNQTFEQEKISEAEAKRQQEEEYKAKLYAQKQEEERRIRLKALEKENDQKKKEYKKQLKAQAEQDEKERKERLMALGYIKPYRGTAKMFMWSGAGCGLGAGILKLFAGKQYDKYQNAELTADAVEARDNTEKLDKFTYITAGTAGACLLTSGV
ncbi:MAG: CsgG/HfaB family protein, partial [Acetobacterium sp.]|nr:CsgG/HfaB family protein [Acetobacterium sp.]